MPKIIKNIEEKILNSANDLFQKNGYDGVDMKEIAKKTGIAVGTLYNYFPNKKQLFLKVLDLNWQKTFVSLEKIINLDLFPKEKLKKLLEKLYEDMSEREVIIQEFFRENPAEMKRRVLVKDKDVQKDRVRDEILNRVEQLIIQIKEEHNRKINKDYERRLAGTLVMSVFSLMKECPMKKKKI